MQKKKAFPYYGDALMIISTVLIATYLSTLSTNSNIITLILDVYCIPYLLYSIPL